MALPRLALVLAWLGLVLSGCDVKKSPESAAAATPERPQATERAAAAPLAEPSLHASAAGASELVPSASSPAPAASPTNAGTNPSAECDARKVTLKARFVEAARCGTDAECEAIQPGCPFGCGLAVNQSTDVGQLKRDIAAFKSECNDCVYRCRPPSGPPVCEAGACSFSARAAK
jgi:hypothetical protein